MMLQFTARCGQSTEQGVDDAEGGWTDSKQGQVCVFGQRYCEFLGHIAGQGKVMPAQCKIDSLVSFVRPGRRKELDSSLDSWGTTGSLFQTMQPGLSI